MPGLLAPLARLPRAFFIPDPWRKTVKLDIEQRTNGVFIFTGFIYTPRPSFITSSPPPVFRHTPYTSPSPGPASGLRRVPSSSPLFEDTGLPTERGRHHHVSSKGLEPQSRCEKDSSVLRLLCAMSARGESDSPPSGDSAKCTTYPRCNFAQIVSWPVQLDTLHLRRPAQGSVTPRPRIGETHRARQAPPCSLQPRRATTPSLTPKTAGLASRGGTKQGSIVSGESFCKATVATRRPRHFQEREPRVERTARGCLATVCCNGCQTMALDSSCRATCRVISVWISPVRV